MHGVTILAGPSDWEILQQEKGYAQITLKGTYKVHSAALEVGVQSAMPVIRVIKEEDNMAVIPWTAANKVTKKEYFTGEFETTLIIPSGGLYRIETGLETRSVQSDLSWMFRGDCVLHVGVGNLFIIAGQSNSAGYSRDYCMDPPDVSVHLFRNRDQWDLASHPMNESTDAGSIANEEMGIPGVSPYLSFGKCYAAYTHMPVGLIQTALGGSSIRRWRPNEGDLYQNMLGKIHKTKGRYAGILWYQGCSDTDPESAPFYYEHFKDFVQSVREELGYKIHFFTMQLNRQINGSYDRGWGLVREAQKRAAREIEGVTTLSTTNLNLSDEIHNSAQANVVLGEKLAKQCSNVLNGTEEYESPTLKNVEFTDMKEKKVLGIRGIWLKLSFAHVKTCFLLYSRRGNESGFTLEDEEGEIEIKSIRANREDRNHIYLELGRMINGETYLSFAWKADPVRFPVVDEVTYLPPLSFYKNKITIS